MSAQVAVAMSGGVDSSVAAVLLMEQGFDVVGVMLRLWSDNADGDNRCCAPEAMSLARHVAALLGIPFHVLDAREVFKAQVVDAFVRGHAQGLTPNPCVECNRTVRWTYLLQWARALGADLLATGHYADLRHSHGRFRLCRATDRSKDQSYVLSVLTQAQLSRTVLPLGGYAKSEVRQIARRHNLPAADRPDSQDLCFVKRGGQNEFLRRQDPRVSVKGPIKDQANRVLGEHHGLPFYTIGQRRRIGLSAPQPLYVLEKHISSNTLIVGPRGSLGTMAFRLERVNWIDGESPAREASVSIRVRYKAEEVPARVRSTDVDTAEVSLEQPLPDVTPGQLAVFYDGDECLGSGVIQL